MSLTLLKSGHYKCLYCDIIFKTQEAAKAHLKTPGHKARRTSARSGDVSALSASSRRKAAAKQTSRLDDSVASQRSTTSSRSLPKKTATLGAASRKVARPAIPTATERSIKSALADSMSSLRSGVSADDSKRSKASKSTKSTKSRVYDDAERSECSDDRRPATQAFGHNSRKKNVSDAEGSAISDNTCATHQIDSRQYDVLVAKLDQIIEKQNLMELRIQSIEQRQELATRDKKRALQDAIDVDPVINENLQEIKRIEAAEKIIQDRLGMLSRSGAMARPGGQSQVRSTVRSQMTTQQMCPMCGSGSGW